MKPSARVLSRPLAKQQDQLFGSFDWQLPHQDRIHQAEDRRVGADAERQCADGGQRERLVPGQRAERVSQVSARFVDQPEAKALPRLLLVFLHGPELEPRDPHGFFRREAPALDQVVGAGREVKLQLVGHVPLHVGAVEGIAPERPHASQKPHHASCARKAVFIASAVRFHRSVSAFSRFRPAAFRL